MNQYKITLTGLTPLLMHNDNLAFTEKVQSWRKNPANKELSTSGDDRSPCWTWLGYAYHNTKVFGIPSDNMMTMLREGGAKVKTGKKMETYKKHTQSGLILDQEQFDLYVNNKTVPIAPFQGLIGNNDFEEHLTMADDYGFELLVKRAKVGQAKHVRVRPMFRTWEARGTLTVLDEELSGLTQGILETVLAQAGALCGLCDWRPSSGKSGTFGRFEPTVEPVK